MKGYRSADINKSGKRSLVFSRNESLDGIEVEVPCGQCGGCRLDRSRDWAIRCVHESMMHDQCCSLTLTYDKKNNPGTVYHRDVQLFIKKLRKKYGKKKIRYYMCGEYGDRYNRPHYHLLLFGHEFSDAVVDSVTGSGYKLYKSVELDQLWKMGRCRIGNVTFESAAYIARYIFKKTLGPSAEEKYKEFDPEYTCMSRASGIGRSFWMQNWKEIYRTDSVVINKIVLKPPKIYDRWLEKENPDVWKKIRKQRLIDSAAGSDERHWKRLAVREKISALRIARLAREYEFDDQ